MQVLAMKSVGEVTVENVVVSGARTGVPVGGSEIDRRLAHMAG